MQPGKTAGVNEQFLPTVLSGATRPGSSLAHWAPCFVASLIPSCPLALLWVFSWPCYFDYTIDYSEAELIPNYRGICLTSRSCWKDNSQVSSAAFLLLSLVLTFVLFEKSLKILKVWFFFGENMLRVNVSSPCSGCRGFIKPICLR